jgi:hypothetical protein
MESTVYDYDTDMHRLPFYIAAIASVCYFIAYGFTSYTAKFDNEMWFLNAQNQTWYDAGLGSAFTGRLQTWTVLCTLRDILAIAAWIIFCVQSTWNIGSSFIVKVQKLNDEILKVDTKNEVYQNIFYGNPYLPFGIYKVNELKPKDKKKT